MIRIRWQMPAYSAGASCFFVQSGILRPQQMKDIKDVLALILSLGFLGYFAISVFILLLSDKQKESQFIKIL